MALVAVDERCYWMEGDGWNLVWGKGSGGFYLFTIGESKAGDHNYGDYWEVITGHYRKSHDQSELK